MICYTRKSYLQPGNIEWGILYETPTFNLGDTPEKFKSVPMVFIEICAGHAGFIEFVRDSSTTNYGNTCTARPTKNDGNLTFDIITLAIGRWK